jgi:hypothetical protein
MAKPLAVLLALVVLPLSCGGRAGLDGLPRGGGVEGGGAGSGGGGTGGAGGGGGTGAGGGGGGMVAGGGGGGGGGGGQACPPRPPAPNDIPSNAYVTFQLTNDSLAERFILTQSIGCDPFRVDGVPHTLGFNCGCQCSPPEEVMTFLRLAPGESATLGWDARQLVTAQVCVWGAGWGCAPGQTTMITVGALQPVASGSYTASFLVLDTAPTSCGQPVDGAYTCTVKPSTPEGPVAALCDLPGSRVVTRAFSVAETTTAVLSIQ